jgi:hypothetical protein
MTDVEIVVDMTPSGVVIGFSNMNPPRPILVEVSNGIPTGSVWDEGNTREPSFVIPIRGEKEDGEEKEEEPDPDEARLQQEGEEDKRLSEELSDAPQVQCDWCKQSISQNRAIYAHNKPFCQHCAERMSLPTKGHGQKAVGGDSGWS